MLRKKNDSNSDFQTFIEKGTNLDENFSRLKKKKERTWLKFITIWIKKLNQLNELHSGKSFLDENLSMPVKFYLKCMYS